jgi:hypothetical protein
MSATKFAAGCLVILAIGLTPWIFRIEDSDEPTWAETEELRARSARSELERPSDPVVRFASSLTELTSDPPIVQASVYIPAYAQIRMGSGRARLDLATTLSIHNASKESAIILKRVTYHNTAGELVQSYLDRPIALKPLATIEVFVPEAQIRGGSGANFVIDWASVLPVPDPVVEAVMIGTVGTTSYSFVSQGRGVRVP